MNDRKQHGLTGKPSNARIGDKPLSKNMVVRVSHKEYEMWRARAECETLKLSVWIREKLNRK